MAKYLVLSADDSQKWRLADDADLGRLRLELTQAVERGRVATVEVQVGRAEPTQLLVNGQNVLALALVETPPARVGTL